jgi:SAM-dependent methyltransferase
MSGFSADWLALREGADHRSRDPALAARLAAHLAPRDTVRIVDIGCGSGSNLRALAPLLGPRQSWRLVDYDPLLLAAAREASIAWADRASEVEGGLSLVKDGRTIAVAFDRRDLAADLEGVLDPAPDLLTAAAFFDLASPDFIARTARAVARSGAAFYTVLTYDGLDDWRPPHPSDEAVVAAFHAHQGGDKGFGPAAGPRATAALVGAFRAEGYHLETARSPWRLGAGDAELIRELATGFAGAVRETGLVPEAEVSEWLAARLAGAECIVGHDDLLALPSGR